MAIAGLEVCPGAKTFPTATLEQELPETMPALDHEIREKLGGDGGGEGPHGEVQQAKPVDPETPRKSLNFDDPHLWQDSQPVPPFHVGTTTPEPSPTQLESESFATVDGYGALDSPKEKSPEVSWFIFGQTGYIKILYCCN